MKLACITACVVLLGASAAFADSLSLQNAIFNSSAAGIVFADPSGFPSTPGLSGNLDGATGLGTLTFTDTKLGPGFFDLFVDLSVSVPFANEFGKTGGGSPAANETWQIDVPDYWCNTPACQSFGLPSGSPDPNDPGASILAHTLANAPAPNNQNGVPGNGLPVTLSNYFNDCGAEAGISPPNALCNNDVALALGFKYAVSPGFRELITLTVSQTPPASGFYLEQIHPADPSNPNGTNPVFLYGSATLQPTSTVPEPGALFLLASGLLLRRHKVHKG